MHSKRFSRIWRWVPWTSLLMIFFPLTLMVNAQETKDPASATARLSDLKEEVNLALEKEEPDYDKIARQLVKFFRIKKSLIEPDLEKHRVSQVTYVLRIARCQAVPQLPKILKKRWMDLSRIDSSVHTELDYLASQPFPDIEQLQKIHHRSIQAIAQYCDLLDDPTPFIIRELEQVVSKTLEIAGHYEYCRDVRKGYYHMVRERSHYPSWKSDCCLVLYGRSLYYLGEKNETQQKIFTHSIDFIQQKGHIYGMDDEEFRTVQTYLGDSFLQNGEYWKACDICNDLLAWRNSIKGNVQIIVPGLLAKKKIEDKNAEIKILINHWIYRYYLSVFDEYDFSDYKIIQNFLSVALAELDTLRAMQPRWVLGPIYEMVFSRAAEAFRDAGQLKKADSLKKKAEEISDHREKMRKAISFDRKTLFGRHQNKFDGYFEKPIIVPKQEE